MRILDLYHDFSINFITEGNRHTTDGWVNTHCPFCVGSKDYHLGYDTNEDYFNCWRCGRHPIAKTLMELLSMPYPQVKDIIKQYGGTEFTPVKETKVRVNLHPFKYPSNIEDLQPVHRRYLERRQFDPDKIIREWGVQGTGPSSFLDGINYSKRILAPIHWGDEIVSFQARTIRYNRLPKYMACPMARETVHHQHIVYGMPTKWNKRGVCVEGITDVWRLGYGSFGIFGISFTQRQVETIFKNFTEVVILFDPEPTAQRQARKLKKQLEAYRVKTTISKDIKTDPGSMSQADADYLMKQLL